MLAAAYVTAIVTITVMPCILGCIWLKPPNSQRRVHRCLARYYIKAFPNCHVLLALPRKTPCFCVGLSLTREPDAAAINIDPLMAGLVVKTRKPQCVCQVRDQ